MFGDVSTAAVHAAQVERPIDIAVLSSASAGVQQRHNVTRLCFIGSSHRVRGEHRHNNPKRECPEREGRECRENQPRLPLQFGFSVSVSRIAHFGSTPKADVLALDDPGGAPEAPLVISPGPRH